MKIKPEHLNVIETAVAPFDTAERRQRYIDGDIPHAEYVKDLDKRYRWDLFWLGWGEFNELREFQAQSYAHGINDNHVDTALRSIVKPLEA